MILSRITSKAQVTLPKAIRSALGIGGGDDIRWVLLPGGEVRVEKVERDGDDVLAPDLSMFTEWADDLDRAYDRL